MADAWYEHRMRCKPEKAVVKLYNEDGTFLEAVNIPTHRWPLNASYQVFHSHNCELLENDNVAALVDTVPYRIGHCYSNAEAVTKVLQEAGYPATQYVGWFFVGETYPIHHSWTVLDGKYVIDLADEFAVLHANGDHFENAGMDKARELLVEFHQWIQHFPNTKRIMPFGVPAGNLLYVGCPCSRLEGIAIYNDLTDTQPHHPCNARLVPGTSKTRMQLMLQEAGLMD